VFEQLLGGRRLQDVQRPELVDQAVHAVQIVAQGRESRRLVQQARRLGELDDQGVAGVWVFGQRHLRHVLDDRHPVGGIGIAYPRREERRGGDAHADVGAGRIGDRVLAPLDLQHIGDAAHADAPQARAAETAGERRGGVELGRPERRHERAVDRGAVTVLEGVRHGDLQRQRSI
jgi:hypothetical protein